MSGVAKCVVVTGANVGLGFECARQLGLMRGVEKVARGGLQRGALSKGALTLPRSYCPPHQVKN